MPTNHRHRSDAELLAFRAGATDIDTDAIAADIATCGACAARLEETDVFLAAIREPDVWMFAAEPRAATDADVRALRAEATTHDERLHAADETLGVLRALPPTVWRSHLPTTGRTEELAQRLIEAATVELDRDAHAAVAILDAAEACTRHFTAAAAAEYRSEIWKNRATALAVLMEYPAALRALRRAERYTACWPTGEFARGQILYGRGGIFFRMGRYDDAIACANAAMPFLEAFGDRKRIAYALNLKASAWTEQGRWNDARTIYWTLRRELEELGDAFGIAMAMANIATVSVRLGDLHTGRKYAIEAHDRFVQLAMPSHVLRMRWVLATILTKEGDLEAAVHDLEQLGDAFEQQAMPGEAARVKLEIGECLVRMQRWDDAARITREAAEAFARCDARVHFAEALAYLRIAVENRTATPELVSYIRTYVEAQTADGPFAPPN